MSYGYSLRFASRIKKAYAKDKGNKVLELGMLCVKHDVTASEVAERLGVSRQTFYYWMKTEFKPTPETMEKVEEVIGLLKDAYEQEASND